MEIKDRTSIPKTENPFLSAQKLLIVRLDSMGDVLMSQPAMRAVSETLPQTKLTLLTSEAGAAVAKLMPEVDEVVTFDAPWGHYDQSDTASRTKVQKTVEFIRSRHFDAAFIFTVYSQNPQPAALFLYQAGIPWVLSYSHENPYALISHWVPDPEPQVFIRHEVVRLLDLVSVAGFTTAETMLSLTIPYSAYESLYKKLSASQLNLTKPWFIIHPGASEERRRLKPATFIIAGKTLSRIFSAQVVVTGGTQEDDLVSEVSQRIGIQSVVLKDLTVSELAALVSLSPLLITNNTGPAHIAAAVKTPSVVAYATTNMQHTPWQAPRKVLYFDVPCKACSRGICPTGNHPLTHAVTSNDLIRAASGYLLKQSNDLYRKKSLSWLKSVF